MEVFGYVDTPIQVGMDVVVSEIHSCCVCSHQTIYNGIQANKIMLCAYTD